MKRKISFESISKGISLALCSFILIMTACDKGPSVKPSDLGISAVSPLGTEAALTDYLVSLGYYDKGISNAKGSYANMLWVGSSHIFDYRIGERTGMVQVITLGKDVIGIYSTYKGEGYQNSAREIVETPGKIFDTVLLDALNTKVMLKDRVTSVLGGNTRTGYEYSDDIIAGQRIEGYSTSMLLALKAYEQDLSLF